MPPSIASRSKSDVFKKHLESIARFATHVSPALAQAVRGLLTAIDYADKPLVESHLNSVVEALRDLVRDTVQKQLEAFAVLKEVLRDTWDDCSGLCLENVDSIGEDIESLLDKRLKEMKSLRDGPVNGLAEKDYPVENASELDGAIGELQALKERISQEWPWSQAALPPVNREMIAEARKQIANGERGEDKDDLIRRNS